MPNIEHGYKRAGLEMISSIIASTIIPSMINYLSNIGLVSNAVIWLLFFKILNILAIFLLLRKMRYWGNRYIIGWLIGLVLIGYILIQSKLISVFEFVIYLAFSLFILIARLMKKS